MDPRLPVLYTVTVNSVTAVGHAIGSLGNHCISGDSAFHGHNEKHSSFVEFMALCE